MKARKIIPTSIIIIFLDINPAYIFTWVCRENLFSAYESDKIIAFALGELLS
jgi:hypothetical protein